MSSAAAAGPARDWNRYPYVIPGCDERWFTLPAAEGDLGMGANTYFLETRLRGVKSGRELAFLVIFAAMRVPIGPLPPIQASFFILSFFDLSNGTYGTMTEFDLPRPPRIRRQHRLSVSRGLLDVRFQGSEGQARWSSRRDAAGAPVPFSYALDLRGRDREQRPMHLSLDVVSQKPPAPVGGDELHGVKTCCAQLGTFSYFQTGLTARGRLGWGDFEDDVEGDCGWIDRQYAHEHFGAYTDRLNTRNRHEWRVLHLDNGWDLSVWSQYDAQRGDRPIPFSGVTAQAPDGEVRTTTDFQIERLSFVRDPRCVLPEKPLAPKLAYLTDRFHLRVRSLGLSVTAEPYVSAPAHLMPVEYWNGPVRLIGEMAGRSVSGFGFHERSKLYWQPHDLVFVLRETLLRLPPGGAAELSPEALANRVWQCDVLLARRDQAGARRHLLSEVAPGLAMLPAPGREVVGRIFDDLLDVLGSA
ncbi:MAG: lipocalin family protein [Deltaproteobacteria bacterium]|nr:lipocalin family protein [Deltaproteobacteria bacterium]